MAQALMLYYDFFLTKGELTTMKTNSTRLLTVMLLASLSFLGACAFSAVDRPQVGPKDGVLSGRFKLPLADTYDLAKVAAGTMGYKLMREDPATGKITTELKPIGTAGNCECGSWNGVPVQGMLDSALILTVSKIGAGVSELQVQALFAARFIGRNGYGMITRDETYRCAGTGALEQNYLTTARNLAVNWKPGSSKDMVIPKAKPQPKLSALDLKVVKAKAAEKKRNAGDVDKSMDEPIAPTDPKYYKLKTLWVMGLISKREFEARKVLLEVKDK